jgi:hypothetical protein
VALGLMAGSRVITARAASPPPQPCACRVRDAFRACAARPLWPGFEPTSTPLAVYDGERTWLFDFPGDVDGMAPDPRCPSARSQAGLHPDVRSNTTITWGGRTVATVLGTRLGHCDGDSVLSTAAVAIHETFHAFQRQHHQRWQGDESIVFTYPCDDDSLAVLVGLELEALGRAVSAGSDAESARWARLAVSLRRARGDRMPRAAFAYERDNEWNEGLAQYVQSRALEQARREHPGARARVRRERSFGLEAVRERVYVAGEAWAVLLDRHSPQWKEQLSRCDSLALHELVGSAQRIAHSKPAHFEASDIARVRSQALASVNVSREARARRGGDFLALPGHTLVIETTGEPLWPQGFDPLNVKSAEGGKVLHTRWVKLGNKAGQIEVLGRSCLTEPAGTHPLFNGVRRVTITGLPDAPEITAGDSSVTVHAQGVDATLRGAQIERSPVRTDIRLGKANHSQ